jgi:dolichol-phosphate mannosyltransferase
VRHEHFFPDTGVAVDAAPLELAVVIPTFNESANVERLLERLAIVLAGISWEAIFVDDNSPDGTAELVRGIARTNRQVRIVHRIGRRGLSGAVVEGALSSAAPVIAVIDGDLQHDETILPQLYRLIAGGEADIAIGTRYADGGGVGDWSASRHRASRIATRIGTAALKADISDPMSGFFAISRNTLMAAVPRLSGIGFKILLDLVASSPQPPRISEIPYVFRSRDAGESKASPLIAVEYLALVADKLIGRFVPLRLVSFLAVGGLGVGVQLGVLGLLLWFGLDFTTGSILAVIAAMTFNFSLNNVFTYLDRRLRGWRAFWGLLSYYAVCSVGAVANIGIGSWMNGQHERWWIAGLAGVLVGAIWNYIATSSVTWRKGN